MKQICLLPVVIFCTFAAALTSSSLVYVCEENEIMHSEGLILVAPGFSYNRGLVRANCTISVKAKPGQKMVVHIYQKFSISACGTDFLRLSDGENSASKCGVVTTYQQIFFTQSNRLDVWYSSNSNKDRVAVSVTAIGCAEDDVIAGSHYKLESGSYTPFTTQYTSTIYCDTGYLLEGSVYTTTSIICEHLAREDKYVWKGNQVHQCIVGVCKVPSQMVNGKVSVGSTLVGAKALFGCNDGFNLIGLSTSICVLHSGIGTFWNNPVPSCEVVDCGPFKMMNAEYNDPYLTTYLSEVGYKCIPGFHAEGAETAKAVCHQTGNWSYSPCTALACSIEEIVDAGYGVVKKSPMKYMAKCNSTGYEVSLTCLYNNSWSIQLPLCSSGTGAVSAASLDSNNLIVIGVCVTLTLLVVFVIILVSIIMLRRKQNPQCRKQQSASGNSLNLDDSETKNQPNLMVGYTPMDQPERDDVFIAAEVQRSSPVLTRHGRTSSDRILYSQVNKLREPTKYNRLSRTPVHNSANVNVADNHFYYS